MRKMASRDVRFGYLVESKALLPIDDLPTSDLHLDTKPRSEFGAQEEAQIIIINEQIFMDRKIRLCQNRELLKCIARTIVGIREQSKTLAIFGQLRLNWDNRHGTFY